MWSMGSLVNRAICRQVGQPPTLLSIRVYVERQLRRGNLQRHLPDWGRQKPWELTASELLTCLNAGT